MDSADLSPALLKAGQEYLDSLRRLRLQPQGLLWSRLNKLRSVKLNSAGNISEMMADSRQGIGTSS